MPPETKFQPLTKAFHVSLTPNARPHLLCERAHAKDRIQGLFRALLLALLLFTPRLAQAQNIPSELVPSQVERLEGDKEVIKGDFPGLIYLPKSNTPTTDEEYHQPYKIACGVYMAERSGDDVVRYARRFIVYANDGEILPTLKRVARTLLLLHALEKDRLRKDHPRNSETVEVWMSRQSGGLGAEAGGRQLRNQIYLFNIYAERAPAEWLREVAHEYGHFILPGFAGYTEPEEWGNGVLGERLFLLWIAQEVKAGRIPSDKIPFVTSEQFDEHLAKRITPQLKRLAGEGISLSALNQRNAEGMNTLTSSALYIESVYQSKGLRDAFAYTESSDGSIFYKGGDLYRGLLRSLESSNRITLQFPLLQWEGMVQGAMVYLPRGDFQVTAEAGIKKWEVVGSEEGNLSQKANQLHIGKAGWRKLKFFLENEKVKTLRLTLTRAGNEVN